MKSFEEYAGKYQNIRMERRNGILQATFHTEGGPMKWVEVTHREVGYAFADIGSDPDNRVVIITGTGDHFITQDPSPHKQWETPPPGSQKTWTEPALWDKTYWEGKMFLTNLLNIEVPVIGVVNGKALVHSEIVLLSDIVLAAEDAAFSDPHVPGRIPPGDGVHVIYPLLIGENRARYFLLTGQELSAQEALRLGVVNEVLPSEKLLPRAWELAEQLAQQPLLNLRYTRVCLTMRYKRVMQEMLGYGLILEGMAAVDDVIEHKG